MNTLPDYAVVDIVVVVIANLINLGLVVIFLVRTQGRLQIEHRVGWGLIAMTLPLMVALVYNAAERRPWWSVAMPALLVLFLLVELLLDYILEYNFRQTRWLGPYLLLFYVALMGMIGYAFLTSERAGIITLLTYFAQLAATAYSYRRVGHGPPRGGEATPGAV